MKRSFLSLAVPAFLTLHTPASAADPAWWAARGVVNASPASNLSPATIGQAKHMAAMALAELQTQLPPQDYQTLQSGVAAIVNLAVPQTQPEFDNQKMVLLVGQLKALAKPFYDRLRTRDAEWLDNEMVFANVRVVEPGSNPATYSPYPWSETTSDDSNKAPATVGQLKAVFSLRFETLDSDHDSLSDSWELRYFPDLAQTATGDPDGDGLSNARERDLGWDPSVSDAAVDSDGDGLSDAWELRYFPNLAQTPGGDPDGDGLSNARERDLGWDPSVSDATTDSDGDSLPDLWELLYFPDLAQTASGDPDGDGLSNARELALGWNPSISDATTDSDADGLSDAWELRYFPNLDQTPGDDPDGDGLTNARERVLGWDPSVSDAAVDSDGDGLSDAWELRYFPDLAQTPGDDPDGDGLTNARERDLGWNPSVSDAAVDSDGDGLSDAWELRYFPNLAQTPGGDPDGDGLTNARERDLGWDPSVWDPPVDTDGDGMPDAWEIQFGLSHLDDSDALADQDGDRIPNLWEYQRGTSPTDNTSRPLADWIVDPLTAGTGNHVATIQEAVDNVQVIGPDPAFYSVIEVRNGRFFENVILPADKKIVLLGEAGYPITEIRNPVDDVATLQIFGEAFVDGFRITRSKPPDGLLSDIARGVSVSLSGTGQASLSNVLIHGHSAESGSGISLSSGRLHLLHATIYETSAQIQGHAIALGSGTRMEIVNSIIRGSDDPSCQQIFVSPTAVLSVEGSFVRNGESGGNASNPLLTPLGWLRRTSPAINFGLPGHVQRDIHDESRAGNPDAGADEFVDDDDDGLPNWLEALGITTPGDDDDDDGTTNLAEYETQGTNPQAADSDGDGMVDAYEVANQLDPFVDDSFEDADGDRIPNIFEYHHTTLANDRDASPPPTFEVDAATGDIDPNDSIFSTISAALAAVALRDEDSDSLPDPYAIILVRSGEYQENVVISGVPILMLGELGGTDGPVRISPSSAGAALAMESPSVVDGFVISHHGGVIGRGVEASAVIGDPESKRRLINCIVRDNSGDVAVGVSAADCELTLIHCTVVGNYAVTSAPGVGLNGAVLRMFNSVIAGNHAPYGVAINQIEVGGASSVAASASAPSLVGDSPLAPVSGWIRMDPLLATDGFADAYSKVVDAGGMMVSTRVLFDIQGQQRPDGSAVDIGADEFVPTYPNEDDGGGEIAPIIDTDGDGIPDQWEIVNSLDPEVPNPETDLQDYLNSRDTSDDLEVHTPLR